MTRVFAMNRRLASLVAERTALAETLDRVHTGAILCDGEGRVVHAGDAARRLLLAAP